MLHTPSYTALNRCAQEGERWSGGYTNQPNPLSSRRALPPLPRTPPRGAGDINATDPAGLSPSPPRLDRATLPESRPACRVPPALHLRKADGHGLRHELRAGKHAPPPSAEVDAGRLVGGVRLRADVLEPRPRAQAQVVRVERVHECTPALTGTGTTLAGGRTILTGCGACRAVPVAPGIR